MSDAKTLLKKARKLIDDKDFKGAEKCCKDILRKDRQNYMALVLLGKSRVLYSDLAPSVFQKAIRIKPSYLLAWQGLANYYEEKKDVSLKVELFPIYENMLKLQMEEEKVIKVLTKLGELGCSLKSSESISSIIKFVSKSQGNLKDVAEKQFIELLKSDVPCKFDDTSTVINILYTMNAANPSDIFLILICKVMLQKANFSSSVKEITELEFFSKNIAVKEWLCQYFCEYFINNNTSFNGFDMEKYLDIISVDMVSSKYIGLLRSMIVFDRGLYLEAYEKCIPLVNIQGTDKIEIVYVIKCTVMIKLWAETQKLAIYFLKKVKDSSLKITLQKMLFESYVKQHKWSEAISIAKEISTDLLNTDELTALANCYIETNQSAKHVLDSLDGDQNIQIQAHTLINQQKYEEAINVLQNSKIDPLKYFCLGKAYWYLKKYDNCLKNLRKSAEVNCDHPDTFYFLGLFYQEHRNDLQKAKLCYEKAHSLCKSDILYVKNLSEVYLELELEHQAFKLLEKTNEMTQNKETWLNLRLGLYYLKKREWEKAIKNFLHVVILSENDLIALECLADAYFGRGSYMSAFRAYNKVMTLNPNKIHTCHCLTYIGNVHAFYTRYDEAIASFTKVLAIDSHHILALKGMSESLIKIARIKISAKMFSIARDNAQLAIDYISKALSKRKEILNLWVLLADAAMLVTRLPDQFSYIFIKKFLNSDSDDNLVKKEKVDIYPVAIACFSHVLQNNPSNTSRYNLAYAYFEYHIATKQMSHCEMAFNLINICIKEIPNSWRSWNLLGKVNIFLKRYDKAQQCFITALKFTNEANVWCNLGALYLKSKFYKIANYCFFRGQSAMPSYPQSWIGQALIAEVIREEEAMDLFRHACRLGYHHTSALGYASWICRTLKNPNWKDDPESRHAIEGLDAIACGIDLLNCYLAYEPTDACALNMFGILQERKGLLRSALKSFEKAYTHATDDKKDIVLLNKARILLRLEKYDEAIKDYKAISEASMDSACGLALALYKSGQYEDSYTVYNMALQYLCNDDRDKADLLVAMAGAVYMLKRKDDAKTLLFHSIQASQMKPTPHTLFALCSLGIINSDKRLTKSTIKELAKYEKDKNLAYDIGLLKSYVVRKDNSITLVRRVIFKTLERHPRHPGYSNLWFCMSQYCLRASQPSFASYCAQRAIEASRNDQQNVFEIGKMFALASVAEHHNRDDNMALKFAKEGLHINPGQPQLRAVLLFVLLSNKKWSQRKDFILRTLKNMRTHFKMTRALRNWVIRLQKKLTKKSKIPKRSS